MVRAMTKRKPAKEPKPQSRPRGRPKGEKQKIPASTFLTPEDDAWIDKNVHRELSKSGFISMAVSYFIANGAPGVPRAPRG